MNFHVNNCCDFEIKIERRWHLLEEIRYLHKRSYFLHSRNCRKYNSNILSETNNFKSISIRWTTAQWELSLNILKQQKNLGKQTLILSYYKHGTLASQASGRYVKMPLKSAGINTKTSPVYSARHAISLGSFMK